MKLFDKIKSFFCSQHKQDSSSDHLEQIFYIPQWIPDERVREALTDQILQWHYMIPQQKVQTLSEKIPDGCIGIMEIRCGGKSVRRQYLKIQEEYVATMTVSYL